MHSSRANPLSRSFGCACHAPTRVREVSRSRAKPRPRDIKPIEPVVLIGKPGSKCRPFIRVEKDPDAFAACNALADEVGPLNTPEKALIVIESLCGDEISEVFGVMVLDIHLRLKGAAETGRGESSSVMAPLQPTLRAAINVGGDYAIIYHVHPSGIEAEPSDADKETTEAFMDAFESIGMPLFDHIIVGGDSRNLSYYSFLENKAL